MDSECLHDFAEKEWREKSVIEAVQIRKSLKTVARPEKIVSLDDRYPRAGFAEAEMALNRRRNFHGVPGIGWRVVRNG